MGVVRIETVEEPVVEKVEAVIEEIITEYEDLEPEAIVDDIINTIEKTVDEEITEPMPAHKFKPYYYSSITHHPYYHHRPIAYGYNYWTHHQKVSNSVDHHKVEKTNGIADKIQLLKNGFGKAGHHYRPYFGRYYSYYG